ncbi:MAG: DNRLRE domain-containing protein, partial [Bacteroidaceae bacterium]|nr:DNRLRE domain-containing protein [Bacteroidaceae bacterium]
APTADAEEKILISDTWVYDAAGNFEKGTLSVVQVKNGLYLLTVGASVDFLTDENTVYPVYIDPTLTISYGETGSGYIEDVTVFEGIPNINCGTFLYNTVGASSSYGRGRTAIRLTGLIDGETWQKLSQLDILSAEFCIYEASGTAPATILVYPLESDSWTESGATWNNIGDYDDTNSYGTASLDNSELASFNITGLVTQHWKGGSSGLWTVEQGFILVSENETTPIKQFYSSEYSDISNRPYVVMTYNPHTKIIPEQSYAIAIGKTLALGIEAAVKEEDIASITWSVDNENIASIDSDTGVLLGKSVGEVTVTAIVLTSDNMQLLPAPKKIRVVPLNGGAYLLKVPGSTLCLTAQNPWQLNGMDVALENRSGVKSSYQWCVFEVDRLGSYKFKPLISPIGYVVPYQNCISLWGTNEGFSGRWIIDKTADGKYTLRYSKGGYLTYNTTTNTVSVSETTSENTLWEIVPCNEMVLGAKLFDLETGTELTAASKTITLGDTKTFDQMDMQPVFYSTWLDYECSWSSSDTTVARMNAEGDGIVGVSPGTATITGTITSAGLQGSCSFTVTVQPLPNGIYYLKNPSTLEAAIVNSSAPYSGCLTTLIQSTDTYSHLWRFEKQSDGYYTIRSHFDNSYYLTAPSTNSSGTQITLQNGSLTDSMKWALTVTESGNFKLTSKGDIGTSNVLTVSGSTGTLFEGTYVEDEEYFDEWLIRKNEVYYLQHYYDIGFKVRYNNNTVGYDALDVIKESEKKFCKTMDKDYGITVISTYRAFQSKQDECKMAQSAEGIVDFEHLNAVCTHSSDCLTIDEVHGEMTASTATNEVGRVLWTGHALTGNPSSSVKYRQKTAVITLKKNSTENIDGTIEYNTVFKTVVEKYSNTLRHEGGHLLSLQDHYCYKKEHDRETCQNYCDICVENREKDRICIMSKTEETKFCIDCYKDIREYLSTLDNKVGE